MKRTILKWNLHSRTFSTTETFGWGIDGSKMGGGAQSLSFLTMNKARADLVKFLKGLGAEDVDVWAIKTGEATEGQLCLPLKEMEKAK